MNERALRRYLEGAGVAPALAEAAVAARRAAPAGRDAPEPAADATPEPQPAGDDPVQAMEELARAARDCTRCGLAKTRTQVVFGVGDPRAALVIVGEAPGRDEDLKGEPFVGRAGRLLDRMLAAIGLARDEVYIMNVLKCRPPNNRNPLPEEVEACARWREAQLDILRPRVFMLLGRFAAQTMLGTSAAVSALRGRFHEVRGVPARVSWHPAYLLRQPGQKAGAWEDWLAVRRLLEKEKETGTGDPGSS